MGVVVPDREKTVRKPLRDTTWARISHARRGFPVSRCGDAVWLRLRCVFPAYSDRTRVLGEAMGTR